MGMVVGDARSLPIQGGTVQCVVTSPPYWGLRDYGTATWDGGDAGCDHVEMAVGMSNKNTLGPDGYLPPTNAANVGRTRQYRSSCSKCGARRIDRQLGLESTPDAYVANMVAVFREVWRVLRDDGTCWVNLGDSYAHNGPCGGGSPDGPRKPRATDAEKQHQMSYSVPPGPKPKDLVGIPWRVAFALQADGWYLRQDIIWAKPNPMPESVRDRCTKAHEYVFLLTKRQRYYYDAEAISESGTGRNWLAAGGNLVGAGVHKCGDGYRDNGEGRDGERTGRNRRSVWTVNTQPYPEAHFATFPEKLVEPCVLAGTKPGDLVLDPFAGSGTVGAVCRRLARRFVGVELNPKYVDLARARMARVQPGLALEVA